MRGIIIGQESVDTALVRLATAREAADLIAGQSVTITPDVTPQSLVAMLRDGGDVFMRSAEGYVRVGRLRNMEIRCDAVEGTTFGAQVSSYQYGTRKYYGVFEGEL